MGQEQSTMQYSWK